MKFLENKKIIIIILILIVIVILIGIIIGKNNKNEIYIENTNEIREEDNEIEEFVQKLEDGSKLNISDKLSETKMFNGLIISNIQLKETEGITTLLADVENKTGTTISSKTVKIDILNKEDDVITTFIALIDEMKVGEKVQINASITGDVANAYNFRIRD